MIRMGKDLIDDLLDEPFAGAGLTLIKHPPIE